MVVCTIFTPNMSLYFRSRIIWQNQTKKQDTKNCLLKIAAAAATAEQTHFPGKCLLCVSGFSGVSSWHDIYPKPKLQLKFPRNWQEMMWKLLPMKKKKNLSENPPQKWNKSKAGRQLLHYSCCVLMLLTILMLSVEFATYWYSTLLR